MSRRERRLAATARPDLRPIVDLETGDQPIANGDGSITVVCYLAGSFAVMSDP